MREKIAAAFSGAQRILVTSHIGIDGDSAGGAMALMEAGRLTGKTVRYVNSGPIPEWLGFMAGYEALIAPVADDESFDLGIVIDTSTPDRVGEVWRKFASMPVVVIDHHQVGGSDINGVCSSVAWIEPRAASVTVMLAEMFEDLKIPLTVEIATALYLGIFTDTMSFQQKNTDPRTHVCAAKLLAAGVKPYGIAMKILEEKRLGAVRLLGRAACGVAVTDMVAWSALSRVDFEETGATEADTEGIIGMLRSVENVRVAALFREQKDGTVKVNLRSKDETDVAKVAATFGGGGHRAAAGCTVSGTPEEVRISVLRKLKDEML